VTSLRRTLLATLLAAVVGAIGIATVATYRIARNEIDTVLDYQLRQAALSLRDRARALAGFPGIGGGSRDFVIQLWDRGGVRLWVSTPGLDLPEMAELGFSNVSTPQGRWRVFSVELGGQVLQVGQPETVRSDLAFASAARTLAPFLMLLPVLAFLIWYVVGRGLAPLDRLARDAATRTAVALDPFPEEGAPEEVRPLVRSLNGLMDRLAAALAGQRAFVADAAHELRTPLAALKLQAQLAARAEEPGERASCLAELQRGLDRAAHVVQQLLTLAREEPGADVGRADQTVALAELVAQVVADHAPLAESKQIDLGATSIDERATVRGDPMALRTLLTNLVDNAIRYSPTGGRVDLAAGMASDGTGAYLEVSDSGPGIPKAERERVFDRFYRRAGNGQDGSGLGLSIVKAIAERHGARVLLGDAPGGGLAVRVELA
jgi:two-component system, OmpR family, sensor kinase